MTNLFIDIKYAFRQLYKSPGFTLVAVLTLALGIGANTAIFSLINSVLLHPLPYPNAEQIVDVMETLPDGRPNGCVSGGAFKDWFTHSSKFAYLAVYENIRRNLTGTDLPERVTGWQVSGDFLSVLGITPILGRGFTEEETTMPSESHVILLTHAFWQNRFGKDAGVLGKTVSLDQVTYTIVGVLPPNALLQDDVRFLVPNVIDAPGTYWGRDANWRTVVGRLLPGVSVSEAQTELRGIKQQLAAEYPSWKENWSVIVTPLQEIYVGKTRSTLVLLMGAVGLVLLIACVNVSNLLLARGTDRSHEMAIRMALGARASRIVRQMLTESVLLALAGCTLGLLLAVFGMRFLSRLVVAEQLPHALYPELNLGVLLFSILVACACGILFGFLPAFSAAGSNINHAVKESGRGSTSRSKRWSQSSLVMSEFALTLVLLIGAGLFLRSFIRLMDTDPGFNPRNTLGFDLSFPKAKYPGNEDRLHFTKDIIERIQTLPGVESVAAVSTLPLCGQERGEALSRPDRPEPSEQYLVGVNSVSGDYFSTVGIRLLCGRVITEADNIPAAQPVLVIDTGVARDLYPNEDPIGQRVNFLGKSCEIVGLVAPVRQRDIGQTPRPRVYGAQALFPNDPSIVVRTVLSPLTLTTVVRKAILEADPDQPIANVRTLEQAVQHCLAMRRTTLTLLGLFAVVAIGLACIGIYGMVSYAIGQRRRELSIRAALGAQRKDIIRMVVMGGIKPSLIGIAIGLAGALALACLIESQLFEVKAYDPIVFIASICLLAIVAVLSVYVPARKAAKTDPMEALRYE